MYVDILILAELVVRPNHGYELKRHVERIMGDAFIINANQLYPALRRFEEMGAVVRKVEHQQGRPDRHVYSITDGGLEVLLLMLRDFPTEQARSAGEFETRVAFFHLLDRAERDVILSTREDVQRKQLAHLEQTQLGMSEDAPNYRYATRLLIFRQQQIQNELAWILELKRENQDEDRAF
jgi:DNA-binding PadR family transcriptional regulator